MSNNVLALQGEQLLVRQQVGVDRSELGCAWPHRNRVLLLAPPLTRDGQALPTCGSDDPGGQTPWGADRPELLQECDADRLEHIGSVCLTKAELERDGIDQRRVAVDQFVPGELVAL